MTTKNKLKLDFLMLLGVAEEAMKRNTNGGWFTIKTIELADSATAKGLLAKREAAEGPEYRMTQIGANARGTRYIAEGEMEADDPPRTEAQQTKAELAGDGKQMPEEFKYAPINRPVIEAAPTGWLRTLDAIREMRETYPYGYVFYDRKLTMDDVRRFEFWPVSNNARQFAIGERVDYDGLDCAVKAYEERGRYTLEENGGQLGGIREIDLKAVAPMHDEEMMTEAAKVPDLERQLAEAQETLEAERNLRAADQKRIAELERATEKLILDSTGKDQRFNQLMKEQKADRARIAELEAENAQLVVDSHAISNQIADLLAQRDALQDANAILSDTVAQQTATIKELGQAATEGQALKAALKTIVDIIRPEVSAPVSAGAYHSNGEVKP